MSALKKLREAKTLSDLAPLIGYSPKGLSYILYKIPDEKKYQSFEIAKSSGGFRTIKAPNSRLSLLQKRLSKFLYLCVEDIIKDKPNFWRACHGFSRQRSIVTNSNIHRNKRHVFNLDLSDFFGNINFGRVRGYFIKDRHFQLDSTLATIIAQITCHENSLPQGSPSSPVISNLIGNLLDARLLSLARRNACSYSRYADDLTFSTNEQLFPRSIAFELRPNLWEVGTDLREEIKATGFSVNPSKTRLSHCRCKQTVTGLVVNTKTNVDQRYYREVRAMCHSLFVDGVYHVGDESRKTNNPRMLEGKLSFIYYIKKGSGRPALTVKTKRDELKGPDKLYRDLLFYRYFIAPDTPLIVTEGSSDISYLRAVIHKFGSAYPRLTEVKGKSSKLRIKFFPSAGRAREVLGLASGITGQSNLVASYTAAVSRFPLKPMKCPVIILCDNDNAAHSSVMKAASKITGSAIHTSTTDLFYKITYNLYLVKLPEGTPPASRVIEDLFSTKLLAITLDGKKFDLQKEHGDHTHYSKVVFANKVVRSIASTTDLILFKELLFRISSCIEDYNVTGPLIP